jgi:hypothetical protein
VKCVNAVVRLHVKLKRDELFIIAVYLPIFFFISESLKEGKERKGKKTVGGMGALRRGWREKRAGAKPLVRIK